MLTNKRVKIIVGVIATALLFIFFVIQGNNQKNAVNIYTGLEEEFVEAYIAAFNKKYPDIKVNIIRDSTGVIASKLMVEKENSIADVVWGLNSSSLLFLDEYDLFKGYRPKNIDEFDTRFYDTENSEPRWVGISVANVGFTVNIKELEAKNIPIPKSYKDLLNPALKGEIVMPNPLSSGTGYSCISGILQVFGEETGWRYLDKLNENIAQYTHSGSAPTKQAVQGEYLVGIGLDYLSIKMEQDNPQVKTIFPEEGSGWDIEASALINKKNIKDGAIKFYEWSLSDEAMQLYAENRSSITLKDEKYNKEIYKVSTENMIDNSLTWASINRKKIVDKWEKKYVEGE